MEMGNMNWKVHNKKNDLILESKSEGNQSTFEFSKCRNSLPDIKYIRILESWNCLFSNYKIWIENLRFG
jgi:hypothetical protein